MSKTALPRFIFSLHRLHPSAVLSDWLTELFRAELPVLGRWRWSHGGELAKLRWRLRCNVGQCDDAYHISSNRGLGLYLTPEHRSPGLYRKEVNIRDRPLFLLEENGLPDLVSTESPERGDSSSL